MIEPLSEPLSLVSILPETILLIGGCIVLLMGGLRETTHRLIPWTAMAAIALAIVCVISLSSGGEESSQGLEMGYMTSYLRRAALMMGAILLMALWGLPQTRDSGEFYSMLLFGLLGLLLVAPASDMVMLFLAVELVSIPTYVLVTLGRNDLRSLEAGTKYFYLGALSAALFAYGLSFLYGVSGSADLSVTANAVTGALTEPRDSLRYSIAAIGVVLTFGALLFKIAAVPLHFYVGDVYQGAAGAIAGLLGFVPKIAGFVAILKLISLTGVWDGLAPGVFWTVWVVAAASATVGNVLAIRQYNVKRMLAYSGIAHSGYMLVGVLAGPSASSSAYGDGASAVLFYAVVYGVANLGAFAALAVLRVRGEACETIRDLSGLFHRQPAIALLMALSMLTLLGMPPTPGFWGKVSLFGAGLTAANNPAWSSVQWYMVALVVIALINSAIGAAYYLRVTATMILGEPAEEQTEVVGREPQQVSVVLCGLLTLILMVAPQLLMVPGRIATLDIRTANRAQPAPTRLADGGKSAMPDFSATARPE
jgi:NADH-quinone oxidoreductase subunit N